MMGINRVTLVANLTADVESRTTPSGTVVAKFSVAVNKKWRDRSGESQESVEYIRIVAFDRLGEVCAQYLHKGSPVYLEGELRTTKWQDKDGNDRWTTEVVAREMRLLGDREGMGKTEKPAEKPKPPADDDPFNDSIPF